MFFVVWIINLLENYYLLLCYAWSLLFFLLFHIADALLHVIRCNLRAWLLQLNFSKILTHVILWSISILLLVIVTTHLFSFNICNAYLSKIFWMNFMPDLVSNQIYLQCHFFLSYWNQFINMCTLPAPSLSRSFPFILLVLLFIPWTLACL